MKLSLSRLWHYTKDYYAAITLYSLLISFLVLATPISVQSLVNTFSLGPYLQPLFVLSTLLFGLLILLGLVKSLQYLLVEYLQRKLYAKFTSRIAQFLTIKNRNNELTEKDKNLVHRYFDVIIVQKSLAFLVTDGLGVVLQTVVGLILISFYHPFFIVFSLIILFSFFLPIWIFGKSALKSSSSESAAKYNVAGFLETLTEDRENKKTVDEVLRESDQSILKFLGARSSHFNNLFMQNIIYMSFFAILNALLLGLGGYLVLSNQLSVGQLVAAEIVVNGILYHFFYAKKYFEVFYDMSAALGKIEVFFGLEQEKDSLTSQADDRRFFQNLVSVRSVYSPSRYKKIFSKFIGVSLVLITLLSLTPWQQTSPGTGLVTAFNPNDRTQTISTPVGGRIERWMVRDGEIVKKGQILVKIVDNDPDYVSRLESNRQAAVRKFEAAKESADTARLNFHRQEELVKEGLSSPKEREKAKISYKKLLSDEASAAVQMAKAEVDLSRQIQQTVTAPRDGQILRILHGSGSINVKEGEPLAQFVPTTQESAVELRLDGNDLPLVFEGRKVRLQFEGWPSVQFSGWPSVAVGSFGGIVRSVDPSVSKDGNFRVMVVPDKNDPAIWPEQMFLRQGVRAKGIVLLDQVALGYEFWRKINSFPKAMENPPVVLRKQKGSKK